MLRPCLPVVFCAVLISVVAAAQNLCPNGTSSDKLICLIPQVYGSNGLVLENIGSQQLGVTGGFQNGLPASLSPLNSAIARQAALLPMASPYSGITFSWDLFSLVDTSTTESLGPILGERAETIGKYRVSVGFAYQYFKFDHLDGVNLKALPAVFTQPDNVDQAVPGTTCSLSPPDSPANKGSCGFIRDIITTSNRLDLTVHEFTTFVTFGLTSRIDVSMAIPIENVRMGISSDATIVDISNSGLHQFPNQANCDSPCLHTSSSNIRNASGVGDITFRVKGLAWKGERAALALGVDVRAPTGDALNFLGAGAAGVKPFVVWSYRHRISPHAMVGYETNGSSVVDGDITTGRKAKLPSQLTYSGGADVWITKWLSAAFELVGQQVFEAQRLLTTTFSEPRKCVDAFCNDLVPVPPPTPTHPDLLPTTGSYNITNASIGAKIKPTQHLVVTGNVLLRLNDGGLRSKAIPLVGVSYTF